MKFWPLILSLQIHSLAFSQPAIRLMAYSQEITPGMIRAREIPAENGETGGSQENHVTLRYYIYAAISSGSAVQFTQCWIRGKAYAVAATVPEKTPVIIEQPEKRTLVPKTTRKVFRLEPGDNLSLPEKHTAYFNSLLAKNELVLEYNWKGHHYYATLKKFSRLGKLHGQ